MTNIKRSPNPTLSHELNAWHEPVTSEHPVYIHLTDNPKEITMSILKVWQNHRQWLAKPILRKY